MGTEKLQKAEELQKKEELQKIKNKINTFPPLLMPQAERTLTEAQRMELIRLLMSLKQFDSLISDDLQKLNKSILLASEKTAQNALYRKKVRTAQFDGVAFMEAADAAMKHFDPAAGAQFLTYFDLVYNRRLVHSAQQQTNLVQGTLYTKLSESDIKLLKQTARLAEQTGLSLAHLPADFYRQIAAEMQMDEAQVRALLQSIYNAKNVESMYLPGPDKDGNIEGAKSEEECVLAHDGSGEDGAMQAALETTEAVAQALDAFADADAKEFPRLFMSNDILGPLKDESGDMVEYARLLLRYETTLWQRIFVADYLHYAFETPPEPDCVKQAVRAVLRYPLQDKTIAAYKRVSKAAISQQRKKYAALWQEYRNVAGCI